MYNFGKAASFGMITTLKWKDINEKGQTGEARPARAWQPGL